jgi:ketosteroid isomerase-like protein
MNRHLKHTRSFGIVGVVATLGAAGLLLSTACAPAPAQVDTAALAAQLTQLDDAWSAAAATRNADSVASFYATDAVAYPPNMPVAVGRAAARDVWAGGFADSTYTISWTTTAARVAASGDMGFTAGSYQESYRGADGNPVTMTGKYLCVWAKQADGSWKATNDMWNADAKL